MIRDRSRYSPGKFISERSSLPGARVIFLALILLSAGGSAQAEMKCQSPPTLPCPDCFALFVMPDTQSYTKKTRQPQGAAHLDLVTRYICNNAKQWKEPRTGKVMPIAMLIQLGDLVDHGDYRDPETGSMTEWEVVDAAFDNLDSCVHKLAYLVTTGNHDYSSAAYHNPTEGYNEFFGIKRWNDLGHRCKDPAKCSGAAGDWFIGGGDEILAHSRNNDSDGPNGPPSNQPGRHRAGILRTPKGEQLLFIGLELAFDFPPRKHAAEGDDLAWIQRVLSHYGSVPTVLFHHSMFWLSPEFPFGPEIWRADSLSKGPPMHEGSGMKALWQNVAAPYPQVFLAFSGHVVNPKHQDDFVLRRNGNPEIAGFLRNYQSVELDGVEGSRYGVGWNVIAAFDPAAGEIRVRSYRIDDIAAYADPPSNYDHRGEPAPTECLDVDQGGVLERTIPYPK